MNILVLTSIYPEPDDLRKSTTKVVEDFVDVWGKNHNVLVIHNSAYFPSYIYLVPSTIRNKFANIRGTEIPDKQLNSFLHRNENGVKIYRVPIKKIFPGFRHGLKSINKQFDTIVHILNENNFTPDIITGHWQDPQRILLKQLKRKYDCTTCLVTHFDSSPKSFKRYNTYVYLDSIDYLGFRSRKAYSELRDLLSNETFPFVCESGIELLNHDVSQINLSRYNLGFNRVLFAGRLIKRKNIDLLIDAVHDVFEKKSYHIDIVGEGPELENLKKLVANNGMAQNVTFHPWLSTEQLKDFYSRATHFIMLSKFETFGLVYLEAMNMGCIVIGTQNGPFEEIIINSENGFKCEPNKNSLSDVLKRISRMTYTEKEKIVINAYHTSREFTKEKKANQYLKVLKGETDELY